MLKVFRMSSVDSLNIFPNPLKLSSSAELAPSSDEGSDIVGHKKDDALLAAYTPRV
jgi:hypothetical protein